jgi:hypothetical protein
MLKVSYTKVGRFGYINVIAGSYVESEILGGSPTV